MALILAACAKPAAPTPTFDGEAIKKHIAVLASDDFEGRGVATPGEAKTVAYITEQFRAAGLEPGGDIGPDGKRTWTQDVTLAKFEIVGPVAVSLRTPRGAQTWTPSKQISIRPSASGLEQIDLKNAPVVFVGYGVTAPEKNWDDFKGADLKGKVMLVLVNDPDFETGKGDFGGKAMTYYGRWTYKYEEAARQGAAGVLVIHETAPAAYPWSVVANYETTFDIVRDNPAMAHAPVEGWIQRDATAALFAAAGQDFEALKKKAQTRDFRPVELRGVTVSTRLKSKRETVVSKNVVGVLPGKKRPDETVIYTAHWDHLGLGAPDATGDKIYNGAIDNADGVAVLIELARAFAKQPRPDRSVVFMSVTAEESGLLGSAYYVSKPLYPLETTVANLNMDALNATGEAHDYTTSGVVPQTLMDDLMASGNKQNRRYTPDADLEKGYFYRSDHFNFAKAGVPAISFGSGDDLVDGGTAAGRKWIEAYTGQRYHQPSDELTPDWNFGSMKQDAALLFDLGWTLASSERWPAWKEGAEFKSLGDLLADRRNLVGKTSGF